MPRATRLQSALKRALDLAGAATGLVVLAPVMTAAAVAIGATMGRPIFWRHVRPGHRGEPFAMYKFRTMRPAAKGEVWFRTDADRLTPVGRLLRKASIDELPGLWNVLKGDMSLVGPRPSTPEDASSWDSAAWQRLAVRPGLTVWRCPAERTRPISTSSTDLPASVTLAA